MRHLSIIAFWHFNNDKISVKGGVSLIKVVGVQKIVAEIIYKIERRFM